MKRFTILLVDDEERILNFLKTKLNYQAKLLSLVMNRSLELHGQELDLVFWMS
jgi:hypothetical protein